MALGKKDKTSGHRADSNGYIHNEYGYAERRRKEVEERDHIIAIGYAERQIADTLKKAGKINTEL